jgi:PHD/YefM family antitoxin component YafN of YafNO toxin-antitoxin module
MLDRWLARTAEHLVLAMIRKGDPVAVVVPRDDYESYLETAEIMDDEQAQAALREGEQDLRDGHVKPYENVRRDLGLG